jgi:hypothetical protein
MKAFRINSADRKVEEIKINDWKDIAPAIGNGCDIFTAPVTLENDDTIYVDDEGLYHPFEGGFMMEGWQYPCVGNAIVQGTDEEGESTEPKTTKEELEAMIQWIDKSTCERWAAQFN